MSWSKTKSTDRIEAHLDSIGDITVEPLVKYANLDDLLTETCCREIYGAHVYFDVRNFAELVQVATGNEHEMRRLIRGLHVYQREVARVVERERMFDGVAVHFQGSRLHALFYRPIRDEEEIATRAVLLMLVLRDFAQHVFNKAFAELGNFRVAAGAHVGEVVGTSNGTRGQREMLFLGSAANYGAKILKPSGGLHITTDLYDNLPDAVRDLCTHIDLTDPAGNSVYRLNQVSGDDLESLCEDSDIDWTRDDSRRRVEDDRNAIKLSDICYSGAETLINLDKLSIYNNKIVMAASIFADVTGFTSYIESTEDEEEEEEEALKVFHAIRRELDQVVRADFDGLRIQFQGDRIQGLYHMPPEDLKRVSLKAVKAAAALQSSMEITLKGRLPDAKNLSLAIGVAIGTTLVSQLGTRGDRDRICLGTAVVSAADLQEATGPRVITVSGSVFEALPEEVQLLFTANGTGDEYCAVDLTADKLERALDAGSLGSGAPLYVKTGARGTTVSKTPTFDSRAVHPSRPYAAD